MIYIVNNYINNKNDSLSYQPELKLNEEFYTEGILEPTTLFYVNYGFNRTTKRVNVENSKYKFLFIGETYKYPN